MSDLFGNHIVGFPTRQLNHISETSRPVTIKLNQKHHYGGGLPTFGYNAGRIRTRVSMATDSSHRVIMGKYVNTLAPYIFDWIFFIPIGNDSNHNISDEFEFRPDPIRDVGVNCS